MFEVSIVDNTKNPAYVGTSIEMRAEEEIVSEIRCTDSETRVVDNSTGPEEKPEKRVVDNSFYKNQLEYLKIKS